MKIKINKKIYTAIGNVFPIPSKSNFELELKSDKCGCTAVLKHSITITIIKK